MEKMSQKNGNQNLDDQVLEKMTTYTKVWTTKP